MVTSPSDVPFVLIVQPLVETIESVYMGKFNQERRWAPGQLLFEHLGWDVIEKALGDYGFSD